MGRFRQLQTGEVFTLPGPHNTWGVGQVIDGGISFDIYIVVSVLHVKPTLQEAIDALRNEIVILATTSDALFYHGVWHRLGTAPLAHREVPRPNWKVSYEGATWVTSYDGTLIRPATDVESSLLDYRKRHSPARVADQFAAHVQGQPIEVIFTAAHRQARCLPQEVDSLIH